MSINIKAGIDYPQSYDSMPDSTLLDQPPAAKFLGMSEAFMQAARTNGRHGIPFIKVGRKVKYRLGDLRQFLASRTRTHTGMAGGNK